MALRKRVPLVLPIGFLPLGNRTKKKILTTYICLPSEPQGSPLVIQLHPTLYNPMDCSLLGSSVFGILQARILEWVAISFSRESCQPRDQSQVSWIAGRLFTIWATRGSPIPINTGKWFNGKIPDEWNITHFAWWYLTGTCGWADQ